MIEEVKKPAKPLTHSELYGDDEPRECRNSPSGKHRGVSTCRYCGDEFSEVFESANKYHEGYVKGFEDGCAVGHKGHSVYLDGIPGHKRPVTPKVVATESAPLEVELTHGRNCAAWLAHDGQTVNAEDCTCGYRWRKQLLAALTRCRELDTKLEQLLNSRGRGGYPLWFELEVEACAICDSEDLCNEHNSIAKNFSFAGSYINKLTTERDALLQRVKELESGHRTWSRYINPDRKDFIGVRECEDESREFLTHNEALCEPYYVVRELKRDVLEEGK